MVLFSNSTKQVILWELTVPWEENMEVAHQHKTNKYQELVEDCRRRGWQAICYPIEIGVRGFAWKSLSMALNKVGITGIKKRKVTRTILNAALESSRWIWIHRNNETWTGQNNSSARWKYERNNITRSQCILRLPKATYNPYFFI